MIRKGFVRYALREGYSLTPVYGFGETDTFSNVIIVCCRNYN